MAKSIAEKDKAAHLHSYSNLSHSGKTEPLVIVGGDDIHVIDQHGRRYVEGMSGLWCASLGFSHPRLIAAGVKALKTLPYYHTFNHRTNAAVAELAEHLLAIAPAPMARVFFANSGSEANDSAVKMVWYYHNAIGKPEKKKIIARRNAYHGVTGFAASMGGLASNHDDFDLPISSRFLHTECPHYFRNALPGESESEFATRLANQLEKMILAEGPETVAAFIAEPVMGAGGVIVPPAGYFAAIQAVLRKYEILMIVDEVICGFGRTGNMFGSTTFGIEPDILTCAKGLSSGYVPISAVMVNDKVYQAIATNSGKLGTFGHGYTYSGHPVAAAVALETLRVIEDDCIVGRCRDLAPAFAAALRQHSGRKHVGDVRAVGLMGALEFVVDKDSRTAFPADRKAGASVAQYALHEGLIVRPLGDTVALCPPLIIEETELDDLFERFGRAIDRFEADQAR
ncbi:aminotransferase [Comamonas thiooxydans]|uniref:Aminotransferase n=1 Tax=Comamonas thiooxydans TaxID=363952 RepID=A0AA42Q3M5_9BURK|nr:aminotransferase [Comamonas thiooxydans]MDH1336652.1 aminotransferase [Comamonas thiooxydans]MDH1742700.1 aminotransferase [Comamonas thiooxydans]MDH1789153.1 aminotransferase [Comamonas thiooxydans]